MEKKITHSELKRTDDAVLSSDWSRLPNTWSL